MTQEYQCINCNGQEYQQYKYTADTNISKKNTNTPQTIANCTPENNYRKTFCKSVEFRELLQQLRSSGRLREFLLATAKRHA